MNPTRPTTENGAPRIGTWRRGRIELSEAGVWPEGTRFRVIPILPHVPADASCGRVIIAGFGLAGRFVAELLDDWSIPYSIIERNEKVAADQRSLGRDVLQGDAADPEVLSRAGLAKAALLALTIPDDDAMIRATVAARAARPDLYILARATFVSKGLQAVRKGADDVILAEQEVALRFHEKVAARLNCRPAPASPADPVAARPGEPAPAAGPEARPHDVTDASPPVSTARAS